MTQRHPEFDVIIAGAGPAGSFTAFALARAGARVLVLDRARFPRSKPCADGLRSVVARRLELSRTRRMWGRRIALVAHYENVGDITQWGEMHVAEDVGYVGFASVDGGFTNVSLVVPEQLARGASGDRGAFLHNWLLQRPQLAPRFKGARRASAVVR